MLETLLAVLQQTVAAAAPAVVETTRTYISRVVRGLLLLLFVTVCRMKQFVAMAYCTWFHLVFLFIRTRTPVGSAVRCTPSTYLES